jgi:hypothetical protein
MRQNLLRPNLHSSTPRWTDRQQSLSWAPTLSSANASAALIGPMDACPLRFRRLAKIEPVRSSTAALGESLYWPPPRQPPQSPAPKGAALPSQDVQSSFFNVKANHPRQDLLDCCIRIRLLAAAARPSAMSPRQRPMSFSSRSLRCRRIIMSAWRARYAIAAAIH